MSVQLLLLIHVFHEVMGKDYVCTSPEEQFSIFPMEIGKFLKDVFLCIVRDLKQKSFECSLWSFTTISPIVAWVGKYSTNNLIIISTKKSSVKFHIKKLLQKKTIEKILNWKKKFYIEKNCHKIIFYIIKEYPRKKNYIKKITWKI